MKIPLAKPQILESDIEAVVEVLRTSQLALGPKLAEFEDAVATYVGSSFAVAVNSGTSALHLAVRCLNLNEGDEVIIPSFAFPAVINVLLQEKLTPVFVEIDAISLNITAEAIEQAVNSRTRAVIVVHTFGYPAEMEAICQVTRKHKLALIEDACEALGAEVRGRRVGAFGDAGLFAFYPNKQITTGEGGVLVTSNPEIARRSKILRSQAKDDSLDWAAQHVEVGYSYRIADINCVLGTAQLSRMESILQTRETLARAYDARLGGCANVLRPPIDCPYGRISWFAYVIRLAPRFRRKDRDRVWQGLQEHGIGAGRYFAPLHGQPVLRGKFRQSGSLAVTDSVAGRVLALPFFIGMTDAEVDEVCRALTELLNA